jgi:hypothetical protein
LVSVGRVGELGVGAVMRHEQWIGRRGGG